MSTYSIRASDGSEVVYETFDAFDRSDIAIGQIVRLPDGRAGEVTALTIDAGVFGPDGGWVEVRAWDECHSTSQPVALLDPYLEGFDECGHPIEDHDEIAGCIHIDPRSLSGFCHCMNRRPSL